ncbi:hypothetical protein BC828DRAFT_406775 [Blastocladiella britannica]|nr:hypothetical protein BC828DRAFT_406775 [Blastocladiella britannica]
MTTSIILITSLPLVPHLCEPKCHAMFDALHRGQATHWLHSKEGYLAHGENKYVHTGAPKKSVHASTDRKYGETHLIHKAEDKMHPWLTATTVPLLPLGLSDVSRATGCLMSCCATKNSCIEMWSCCEQAADKIECAHAAYSERGHLLTDASRRIRCRTCHGTKDKSKGCTSTKDHDDAAGHKFVDAPLDEILSN